MDFRNVQRGKQNNEIWDNEPQISITVSSPVDEKEIKRQVPQRSSLAHSGNVSNLSFSRIRPPQPRNHASVNDRNPPKQPRRSVQIYQNIQEDEEDHGFDQAGIKPSSSTDMAQEEKLQIVDVNYACMVGALTPPIGRATTGNVSYTEFAKFETKFHSAFAKQRVSSLRQFVKQRVSLCFAVYIQKGDVCRCSRQLFALFCAIHVAKENDVKVVDSDGQWEGKSLVGTNVNDGVVYAISGKSGEMGEAFTDAFADNIFPMAYDKRVEEDDSFEALRNVPWVGSNAEEYKRLLLVHNRDNLNNVLMLESSAFENSMSLIKLEHDMGDDSVATLVDRFYIYCRAQCDLYRCQMSRRKFPLRLCLANRLKCAAIFTVSSLSSLSLQVPIAYSGYKDGSVDSYEAAVSLIGWLVFLGSLPLVYKQNKILKEERRLKNEIATIWNAIN